MPPRGKIPDRWLPYKACGDVIEGTRFICFKVPLHKKVLKERGIKTIWDVPAVIAEIPKLGAVIDLTNTARYYDPREFEEANINHRKILMPGREIPPDEKVQEFMDAVDQFLGKDCDSLIGVHCTHGLNRTGFMVCRYMRDRLNMPAEDAIKRFEKARGYEIEREIYRADLLGTTYVPPPDFGKATVIKPIYEENGVQPPNQDNHEHGREVNGSQSNEFQATRKRNSTDNCRTKYETEDNTEETEQKKKKTDNSSSNNDENSENKVKKLTRCQKRNMRKRRRKKEMMANSVIQESYPTESKDVTNSETKEIHIRRKLCD